MLMLMPMLMMVALTLMLLLDASDAAAYAAANDANVDAKIPNDARKSCWCLCYAAVASVVADDDVA